MSHRRKERNVLCNTHTQLPLHRPNIEIAIKRDRKTIGIQYVVKRSSDKFVSPCVPNRLALCVRCALRFAYFFLKKVIFTKKNQETPKNFH